MPFIKGKSGNPKGKPKGTTNKLTSMTRQRLEEFIANDMDALFETIRELEGEAKVKAYIKLLEFAIPKLRSIDIPQAETTVITVEVPEE